MTFPPFSVLAHVERRRILTELAKTDGPVDVPVVDFPLIDGTADAEILNDVLYYHLPKMARHGYVTFDREEGTVARGPRFDVIRPYLGSSNGHRGAPDRA